MSMNFPPPGPPPSGQPPGGPPSDTPPTPRKNKLKIRATIYRAATHIKRATLGKDRAVKTEEIKKKKKKEEAKRPAIAPFPAPAPTPIFAPVQQGGLPAPMTAPAMPVPVTQDDFNYHAYMQAQQLGHLAPFGVTTPQPPVQQMPAQMPVIITATQQLFIASQPPQHVPPQPAFTLSASQPAKGPSANWSTRASECMEELLARLENGDPDEISSGFAMMQDIAKERTFTGDTIDGWIAAALANYPLDALQKVIKHAIELLPTDSLLADSVRLGIKRMLVPLEIIRAVTAGEGNRVSALSEILRDCCNPAKWGSKRPDGMQANAMMRHWLNRALATLSDEQLHALNREIGKLGRTIALTVIILDDLLATTYWERVVRYAKTFDQ